MTRIVLQALAAAPEESKTYLENARHSSGFIPNLLLALSNSPQVLQTHMAVDAMDSSNSLSAAERGTARLIATAVYDCSSCVARRSVATGKKKTMPPVDLQALCKWQPLPDPHLEAIASFAREITAIHGAISEAAWRGFRVADYGERQTPDVILGVNLATLCNFTNGLAQAPLNTGLSPWAWSD